MAGFKSKKGCLAPPIQDNNITSYPKSASLLAKTEAALSDPPAQEMLFIKSRILKFQSLLDETKNMKFRPKHKIIIDKNTIESPF